eukprot:7268975-Prymnesium_polylepis.1
MPERGRRVVLSPVVPVALGLKQSRPPRVRAPEQRPPCEPFHTSVHGTDAPRPPVSTSPVTQTPPSAPRAVVCELA